MKPDRPLYVKRVLQLFVIATFLGVFLASQQYIMLNIQGEKMPLIGVLIFSMPFWYLWALFAPLVVWLARRVPLVRTHWVSKVAAHVLIASVLAFLHSLILVAIQVVAAGCV